MPIRIVAGKISFTPVDKNRVAIGIEATHRIFKRLNINSEYYYLLDDRGSSAHSVLSFGIDLGAGATSFYCTSPIPSVGPKSHLFQKLPTDGEMEMYCLKKHN